MRGILSLILCAIIVNVNSQDRPTTDPEVLYALGQQLYDNGKYNDAADTLRVAAALFVGKADISGQIKAQQLHGECLANLSRCEEALDILSKTLELAKANFAEDTREVADGYYYLARATGGCARKWEEAVGLMNKSTALKRKVYGEDMPEVALNHTFMGYMQHNLGRYDSAIHYLDIALQIGKDQSPEDEVETSNVLFHLGNAYMMKGDLARALELELQSLAIREVKLGPDHASLSNTITVIGAIYQRLGNHERALEYFHKGLEIRKRSLGLEHMNVAASYYTIGTVYSNIFNYDQAIRYTQQGNRITEKVYGESSDILPTYYAYTGRLYSRIGEYETAEVFFEEAEKQAEKNLKSDHPYLGLVYSMIAEYYSENGVLTHATTYSEKAIRIFQDVYGKGTERESGMVGKLAGCYLKNGQGEKAMELYRKALVMLQKKHGPEDPRLANAYHELGVAISKQGLPKQALEQYRMALRCLSSQPETLKDIYANPAPEHLGNRFRALNIGVSKVEGLAVLARQDSSDETHRHVLEAADFCMDLISEIDFGYNTENERTELEALSRRVFNRMIDAAYVLYDRSGDEEYVRAAFIASEKSRAAILLESMRDANAKKLAGVPDSLIEEERDLKILLAWHRNQVYRAEKASKREEVERHQQQAFYTDRQLEQLKRRLEAGFPAYYHYRYTRPEPSLDRVRDLIEGDTEVVEYYVGDSVIYAFGITDTNTKFHRIPKTGLLLSLIRNYQRSLSDARFIINHRDSADYLYTHSAAALYDELVGPLVQNLTAERLVIVPDDILAQTNFGVLLSEKVAGGRPDYRSLPYLLRDYQISYAYATEFVGVEADGGEYAQQHRFAGFAPSYPDNAFSETDPLIHPLVDVVVRDGMLPLPGAQKEVEMINSFMGGDTWLAQEATETNFKQHASAYAVIHLAMHSLLNNENPNFSELLFNPEYDDLNDGYLNVAEIYNLNLRARMVVLSACSSGAGKVKLGEGPITLSRAFSYAGCPSVVMSLWKIPDNVTAEIMAGFYGELSGGYNKDEALRNAQLKFLNETTDPINHHPYFWAGFVVMGDTTPLPSRSSYLILVGGVLSLVLVSAAVVAVRRRRKAETQKASSIASAS